MKLFLWPNCMLLIVLYSSRLICNCSQVATRKILQKYFVEKKRLRRPLYKLICWCKSRLKLDQLETDLLLNLRWRLSVALPFAYFQITYCTSHTPFWYCEHFRPISWRRPFSSIFNQIACGVVHHTIEFLCRVFCRHMFRSRLTSVTPLRHISFYWHMLTCSKFLFFSSFFFIPFVSFGCWLTSQNDSAFSGRDVKAAYHELFLNFRPFVYVIPK